MPPLGLFLSSFDLLESVFLREAGQYPAFTALRHGQLDLALRDGRKVLAHGLLFLDLVRKQNGFRHGIALGVILLDERGEHLRRIALGDMEERVFLILQGAAAVMQHADTRTGLSLHERDDIQLRERTRDNVLLGPQLLDGPQTVAQHGGPLELELFGGFVFSVSSRSSFFASPSNSETACSISAWYSSGLTFPVHGAQQRPRCWLRHGRSLPMSRGNERAQLFRCSASLIVSMARRAAPRPMYGPK